MTKYAISPLSIQTFVPNFKGIMMWETELITPERTYSHLRP